MPFRIIVSDTVPTRSSLPFKRATDDVALNWLGKNRPTWKCKIEASSLAPIRGPMPIEILFWSSFLDLGSFLAYSSSTYNISFLQHRHLRTTSKLYN